MADIELIAPTRQKEWGWPAVLNFYLGGAGAGLYVMSLFIAVIEGGGAAMPKPFVWALSAPLLVSLGFLSLTVEAGRPERGIYLFRHLRNSWISRETLAGAIFLPAAIFECFFPHPALNMLTAIAAIGLIMSQGMIVYRSRAVAAWNSTIIPFIFLSSGLTSGYGLMMMMTGTGGFPIERNIMVIGFICVTLNLALWILYLYRSNTGNFRDLTKRLRGPFAVTLIIGIGHLIPMLLLFLQLMDAHSEIGLGSPHIIALIAGSLLVFGIASQKTGIIIGAGYTRGIRLNSKR